MLSPHPRAKACSCESAQVLYDAARAAGAPEHIIQCIDNATMEGTEALMRHPRTSVILATGGAGIVKAAYSCGKPAYGVGPGNVPVLIDASAPLAEAVAKVVQGKSFDYGTICSSEQTIVGLAASKAAILEELRKCKAYLCSVEQSQALAKILIAPNWRINPECVGQSPTRIAQMAGFSVPAETSILAAEIGGVGKAYPLSMEKLSPVLSLLFVAGWEEQVRACQAILKFGGLGHTSVIHAADPARIREYGLRIPSFRVLVNTPAPQGSTGITTGLQPAMTLGCGAMAGNATSDNIGPQHLMNVKRVAMVIRKAEDAFEIPSAQQPATAGEVRHLVGAAIERFLTQRGFGAAPTTRPATPAATIVDKFLRSRTATAAVAAPPPPPSCSSSAAVTPLPPPPPAIAISEFVCEADVRSALQANKKIHIGPRTIVTPSARELGNQHDILVTAQRS